MDTNSIMMMMLQDKLPKDAMSLTLLREKLDKMSEAKRDEFAQSLPTLKLKSPKLGLILGIFFGLYGTDRLYKGDKGKGIAKLALTLTFFGIIVSSVWTIVDWFIVHKGIRNDNLQKILSVLES